MPLPVQALLSSGSIIDLDATFFAQLALFWIAFFLLKAVVFRPMIALFDAREQAIDGARDEARRMEREAKESAQKFDEQMRAVRLSAQTERDRLRQEGLRLERTLLERVRAETNAAAAAAEAKLEAEAQAARADFRETVPTLAKQIATRLLGREVSG